MEPTSQLIRLSIPGSIFVLAGVGTYAFAEVLWGEQLSDVEALTKLTTSIAAIAASIPLGFLIYQVYYWRYSPFVFRGIVSRDRGRDALWHLPSEVLNRLRTHFDARLDVRRHHRTISTPLIRRLKLLRLHDDLLRARYKDEKAAVTAEDAYLFEKDNRSLRRIYSDNWYENWDVFRGVLDLVATEGGRPEIKRNFTTLYDIYHSLGASRLAVTLGPAAGFAYLGGTHREDIAGHVLASVIGFFVVVFVACTVAYILHRTRIATWRSAIAKIRLDLTASLAPGSELVEGLPEAERFTRRKSLRRASEQHSRPHRRPIFRRLGTNVAVALLVDVGSSKWLAKTSGILDPVMKIRYQLAVLFATGVEAPRTLVGRFRRHNLGPDPSDVEIPETEYAKQLTEACADVPQMVREHGYRSYIFASALGALEGVDYDKEALFSATMLHAHAFSRAATLEDACFTAASVDFASSFLHDSPFDERVKGHIADAIGMHLNPAVGPPLGALQHLTHDGILLDMLGVRAWELDREGLEHVLEAHPRFGLTVRADADLREHSKLVPNGRVAGLYRAGFKWALKLSRWWSTDRVEVRHLAEGKMSEDDGEDAPAGV
jgi:hypothetical protein